MDLQKERQEHRPPWEGISGHAALNHCEKKPDEGGTTFRMFFVNHEDDSQRRYPQVETSGCEALRTHCVGSHSRVKLIMSITGQGPIVLTRVKEGRHPAELSDKTKMEPREHTYAGKSKAERGKK